MPDLTKPEGVPAADRPTIAPPAAHAAAQAATHTAAHGQKLALASALHVLQRTDPGLAALVASGRPYVRCGAGCGFVAVSSDPLENRRALEAHNCPNSPDTFEDGPRRSWLSLVYLVIAVVGIAGLVLVVFAERGQ